MLPRECTTVRGRCAREQDLIQVDEDPVCGVFGYSMGEGRKIRDREMNELDVHAGEMLIGDLVRRMATPEKLLRKGWGDGDGGGSEAQHLIRRCAPCRQSVNFQFSDTALNMSQRAGQPHSRCLPVSSLRLFPPLHLHLPLPSLSSLPPDGTLAKRANNCSMPMLMEQEGETSAALEL